MLERSFWTLLFCLCLTSSSFAQNPDSESEPSLWDDISEDYETTFPTFTSRMDKALYRNGYIFFAYARVMGGAASYALFPKSNEFAKDRTQEIIKQMGPGVERRHKELLEATEEVKDAKKILKKARRDHGIMATAGEPDAKGTIKYAEDRLAKANATLEEAKHNYKGVKKTLMTKLSKTQKASLYANIGKANAPRVGCGIVTVLAASDLVSTLVLAYQGRKQHVWSPTCSLIKIGAGNTISALTGPAEEDSRGESTEEENPDTSSTSPNAHIND